MEDNKKYRRWYYRECETEKKAKSIEPEDKFCPDCGWRLMLMRYPVET